MKFNFEIQKYQTDAVDAIVKCFEGQQFADKIQYLRDRGLTEETITKIAKEKPYYFVMKDSSMANDSVATNFEQIFITYSPETVRKVL